MSKEVELDLSVFKSDFDPHARGRQCLRELNGIKENSHPHTTRRLSSFNQQKLLEYSAWMIHKLKRDEFSVSSFEKNLSESWKLCLFLGEKKAPEITEKDLKSWWAGELTRYEQKKIKHGSLRKEYECAQTFLKWLAGLNGSQRHPLMQTLDMPKQPRAKLIERMPSQSEIKKLIEAVNTGQKFSIRDQAIIALANDTGARISEILSMRNKHIRPEKNYLVVSFPESKTAPRTVISYLAKSYLDQWAKHKPRTQLAFYLREKRGRPLYSRKKLRRLGIWNRPRQKKYYVWDCLQKLEMDNGKVCRLFPFKARRSERPPYKRLRYYMLWRIRWNRRSALLHGWRSETF